MLSIDHRPLTEIDPFLGLQNPLDRVSFWLWQSIRLELTDHGGTASNSSLCANIKVINCHCAHKGELHVCVGINTPLGKAQKDFGEKDIGVGI